MGHLLSYNIMVVIIDFFSQISVGVMKGHDSIRGSGPFTEDRHWKAAVIRGRGWGILTSPLNAVEGYHCLNYIDDFCRMNPSKAVAQQGLNCFLNNCERLGLQVAPEKTARPTTSLEWLGYHIDTEYMTATIPEENSTRLSLSADSRKRKLVLQKMNYRK